MTSEAVAPPARRQRNRIGVVALVLVLITIVVPVGAWITMWIVGATQSATTDDAIYVGLLGGAVFFFGAIALLSPLSMVGLALGIVSLFRPGGKAPGVVAIVFGALGSVGLFGLPFVLDEIIPR